MNNYNKSKHIPSPQIQCRKNTDQLQSREFDNSASASLILHSDSPQMNLKMNGHQPINIPILGWWTTISLLSLIILANKYLGK